MGKHLTDGTTGRESYAARPVILLFNPRANPTPDRRGWFCEGRPYCHPLCGRNVLPCGTYNAKSGAWE